MATSKKHTAAVTKRFYQESQRIIALKGFTQEDFVKSVGTTSSNLNRMKTRKGNYATIEQCCLMIKKYGTSAEWLFNGDPRKSTIKSSVSELLRIASNLDKLK